MLYPLQNASISTIFSYKTYRIGFSIVFPWLQPKKKKREEKGLGIEIHKLIENLIEDI